MRLNITVSETGDLTELLGIPEKRVEALAMTFASILATHLTSKLASAMGMDDLMEEQLGDRLNGKPASYYVKIENCIKDIAEACANSNELAYAMMKLGGQLRR